MGLDMYLSKKTYVRNWEHMSDDQKHSVVVTKGGQPVTSIKPERVSYIEEEVMYWRKANQIHNWFVTNVQEGNDDCKSYYVSGDQLQELLDTCKKALEVIDGATIKQKVINGWGNDTHTENVYDCEDEISEILPPTSGFFFGGTEIDSWYRQDIANTIEKLTELIEEDPNADYEYHSSW
jgi:hypothetical protein